MDSNACDGLSGEAAACPAARRLSRGETAPRRSVELGVIGLSLAFGCVVPFELASRVAKQIHLHRAEPNLLEDVGQLLALGRRFEFSEDFLPLVELHRL